MADSIFDLPENRDGKLENLGIPSNKTRNNQTTAADFDVYYDLSKSMYTKNAVNKTFAYRSQRDSFEFQNMFSGLVQSMLSKEMMLSLANNNKIEEVIEKAHDQNTDLLICGKLGIEPPMIVTACDNMSTAEGVLVRFCTPKGDNFITFNREYVGGIMRSVAKGLYIDGEYIINFDGRLRKSPLIDDILNNMVRKKEIFDINDNILNKHIKYIMYKPGTRLDNHIKNIITEDDKFIHVTEEEKKIWNSKYYKPANGIPKEDLEKNLSNEIDVAYKHALTSSLHVSVQDRRSWDNKFDLPPTGIDQYHLSLKLQDKINNMVIWNQLIDIEEGKIKKDLLPDMDLDIDFDKYLEREIYEKFLEEEWKPHSNPANIRHVLDGERDVWNGKYHKPDDGIPETDLQKELADKINKAVQSDYLFNYYYNGDIKIKDKFLPVELGSIISHIRNEKIHLTEIEKEHVQRIGDPSTLNTTSKTVVSAINELLITINNLRNEVNKLRAESHLKIK